MGYYTYFSLTVSKESKASQSEIHERLRDLHVFENIEDGKDGSISANGYCKWYDHDDDLLAISVDFPSAFFELNGEGESSEDMWYKYYQNGAMQECYAEITYPDYDPKEMKQIIPPRMSEFKAEVADLL